MKHLFFFYLLFFTPLTYGNQIIGSIAKLKGQVTMLELGSHEAKEVKEGQSVTKEASILTHDKSFAQILLLDKTQINVGPNSKISLDQTTAEKIGFVSLLKGMIRTEVVKELGAAAGTKDKFFIKTRTAAMGIRGTDFLINYNPDNNITNLITFRGKVAMVKTENNNFKESLSAKETVMVESGKFAAISDNLKNATEPVKISPVQFTGLKLNREMDKEANTSKEQFQAELQKTIKEYADLSKKEIAQGNLAAHEFDVKNQILKPTSGGVVDLSSGIYVAPTINKENFNKNLNIYELKSEKGEITEAGTYIPPKGVILDAQKGFVADPKNKNTDLHAELAKLNSAISGQIIRPSKPNKEELINKGEDAYDKYFIKE